MCWYRIVNYKIVQYEKVFGADDAAGSADTFLSGLFCVWGGYFVDGGEYLPGEAAGYPVDTGSECGVAALSAAAVEVDGKGFGGDQGIQAMEG